MQTNVYDGVAEHVAQFLLQLLGRVLPEWFSQKRKVEQLEKTAARLAVRNASLLKRNAQLDQRAVIFGFVAITLPGHPGGRKP